MARRRSPSRSAIAPAPPESRPFRSPSKTSPDRAQCVAPSARPGRRRPAGAPTEVVGATMQEQTRQCLRNVQAILEAAGSSLDRVVKVTVLLARPELYREMKEAYAEFFPGQKPARAMAQFGADIPGVQVAI